MNSSEKKLRKFSGKVQPGLGVASGIRAVERGKPELERGTIFLQRAAMKHCGFDAKAPAYLADGTTIENKEVAAKLDALKIKNGTMNVHLSEGLFLKKGMATFYIKDLCWNRHTYESFFYFAVIIEFNDQKYQGFIYRPGRSRHAAHTAEVVELLAPEIPHLRYGNVVSFYVPESAIRELSFWERQKVRFTETTEEEILDDAA